MHFDCNYKTKKIKIKIHTIPNNLKIRDLWNTNCRPPFYAQSSHTVYNGNNKRRCLYYSTPTLFNAQKTSFTNNVELA